MSRILDIMLMKSQTTFSAPEPRPVGPALLAAFGLAPLLATSVLLAFPPSPTDIKAAPAVSVEAPTPVNMIGALEGLPTVQQ